MLTIRSSDAPRMSAGTPFPQCVKSARLSRLLRLARMVAALLVTLTQFIVLLDYLYRRHSGSTLI